MAFILGNASVLVKHENLFQGDFEHLAEFRHVFRVVPLPELTMQGGPRNEGGFVRRDAVQALCQPCVNI